MTHHCEVCRSPTVLRGISILGVVPVEACATCTRKIRQNLPMDLAIDVRTSDLFMRSATVSKEFVQRRESYVRDLYHEVEKLIERMKKDIKLKKL